MSVLAVVQVSNVVCFVKTTSGPMFAKSSEFLDFGLPSCDLCFCFVHSTYSKYCLHETPEIIQKFI
jgi:hypothetical protein